MVLFDAPFSIIIPAEPEEDRDHSYSCLTTIRPIVHVYRLMLLLKTSKASVYEIQFNFELPARRDPGGFFCTFLDCDKSLPYFVAKMWPHKEKVAYLSHF